MKLKTPKYHLPRWRSVSAKQWRDWRWQWQQRINDPTDLGAILDLDEEAVSKIAEAAQRFRLAITPFYAELLAQASPDSALWKQVVPDVAELQEDPRLSLDPLAEARDSPLPGLVHRYADRALLLLTNRCAVYCRYCNRRRLASEFERDRTSEEIQQWLEYLQNHSEVREVILSGGDPLCWSDARLDNLLAQLRQIAHLDIIRIGTRIPVVLPYRVTKEFCRILQQHQPVYLNIHINHPAEITEELRVVCDHLTASGIPLGSQTVLLKGINDAGVILQELYRELLKLRVKPYCLYHPDPVQGTAHFRLPVARGLEIIDYLIANTSGLAIPHYIVDAPDGVGKIPLLSNRIKDTRRNHLELQPFKGESVSYPDDGCAEEK